MAGMLEWLLQSGHLGGPRAGLLANMPGAIPPPEEAPAADPNAGAYRPDSPLAALFGKPAAPAAPSSSGAEPSDVWGPSAPSTNDPFSGEPQPIAAADVPLPRPRPNGIGDGVGTPLSLAPSSYDDEAALPPAAQLAEGRQPVEPNAPPMPGTGKSLIDRIFNPNNAATMLALGGGFAGAGSIGTGMRRAFSAAAPAAAVMQTQNQKQMAISDTYKAVYQKLLSSGMPSAEAASQALAMAQNPELLKVLAPDIYGTKPRTVHMVKDAFGNETPYTVDQHGQWYDVNNKKVSGPSAEGGAGLPGSSGSLSHIPENYNEKRRDEDFMKALEKQDAVAASGVKAIVEGRAAGTGRNLQKLVTYASRYEKDFQQQDYLTRMNLEKSYRGGGEGFKQLRAANTAITHGVQLKGAIDDLRNFDTLPALNHPTGLIARQYDKKYQAARKTFEANAEPFARELDFALNGKSTVSGQNEIRKLLNVDASGVENHATIDRLMSLLKGRVDEHEHAYAGGRKSTKLPLEALSQKNRDSLDAIISGSAKPGTAPAAGVPPPGNYVFDPATKRLVPAP